jgi:hypothetical protein
MLNNPDSHAEAATAWVKSGNLEHAFNRAVMHYQSKAMWVLVNGKWVPREGVMRHE